MAIQVDIKYNNSTLKTLTGVGTTTYSTKDKVANSNLVIDVVNAGLDTSDANATANKIKSGYIGYVNGERIVGAVAAYDGSIIAPTPTVPYLCFTANTAGSTITCPQAFEYSADGTNWSEASTSSAITLSSAGNKIYMRRGSVTLTDWSPFGTFTMTGSIAASGNIMSLIDNNVETTVIPVHGLLQNLFKNCTALTTAPIMGFTTVTQWCCDAMFEGCTSLTTPPTLSATTLAAGCYANMFTNCTGLTTVANIPATTLPDECCAYMYNGCTGLKVYSASGTGHTNTWRVPTTGTGTAGTDALTGMVWGESSGEEHGTISVNTTYYLPLAPV